jgi:Head fiber protein.
MSYNAKNYTEQGGDVTHFGGKVIFEEGSQVEGLPSPTVPDATTTAKGLVKQAAAVADAAGEAPTATEYNALLASLRSAGILAPAE